MFIPLCCLYLFISRCLSYFLFFKLSLILSFSFMSSRSRAAFLHLVGMMESRHSFPVVGLADKHSLLQKTKGVGFRPHSAPRPSACNRPTLGRRRRLSWLPHPLSLPLKGKSPPPLLLLSTSFACGACCQSPAAAAEWLDLQTRFGAQGLIHSPSRTRCELKL